ncbi:thiamine pyrophosphate-dependent dehydrogenase E1 component subunit alpha [Ruicaihuangia caeni]|uniref:thiamine pyrophosphate-dependent dehydrogenase E1 component subunit alpha n=1 Tax=Ruicaihuangia caeni TaxID=3042517 RepID=UPI00338DAFAE
MPYTEATIRLLSPEGKPVETAENERFRQVIDTLSEERLQDFHRHMVAIRAFDVEAANLQRQGQMALWVPSMGQEAAQVGSAFAARPQDHIFPSYREHVVARIRGVDIMRIIEMMRGLSHGGWDPADHGNFHLYTLVIGSQALHATGYAMGIGLDGACGTGDPERDAAVLVYFGDGATSQGDVSEALVFAASYQTPQVFFVQNNQWAISVPVSTQSRVPLYRRGDGFGIPGTQVDGNDVLAAYAVSLLALDEARNGDGPRLIEAVTYRVGAHTTSDDPTKYRTADEHNTWLARDPIQRYEAFLRDRGASDAYFEEVRSEAADLAADTRRRTLGLGTPKLDAIFDHVYSEPHSGLEAQRAWLKQYEAQMEAGA